MTYLRPLTFRVVMLSLLLAISIGLQIYNPLLLRSFIDRATTGGTLQELLLLAGIFFGLALLTQGVSVMATYLSQDISWRATNRLRHDLTLHCLRQDLAFHHERPAGELIERIDGDVTALSNFFSQFVILVLSQAVLLVGILVVLFRVDWRAGLSLTAFSLLSIGVLVRVRHIATPHWQEVRQQSATFFGFLGERLSGREDLRANGAEPYVMNLFYRLMRSRCEADRKASLASAVMIILSLGLLAVGMSTAFGVSAYLVRSRLITTGTAYMIFFYTEQLRRPIEQLVTQMQDLGRAGASIERVRQLFATKSEMPQGNVALPAGRLSVSCTDLSFGYVAEEPVIPDLSFRLAPGRVLGLVGRTGSGKSTVARLLTRLDDPDQGEVCLGGVNLMTVSGYSLRQRVALVTQDVHLFRGTLRENLTLFDKQIPDERLLEAFHELGMWAWYQSLPQGLQTEISDAGTGLSAGEAQLIALARAFLRDPGLIILDEASAKLDPATEQRIEQALDRLLRGRTAIIIAHRLSTLNRADEILVLEEGRLLETGPRQALADDPSSYFHRLLRTGAKETLA